MDNTLEYYLEKDLVNDRESRNIAEKVLAGQQIDEQEGFHLYDKAETSFLAVLAGYIRRQKNDARVYFIKNVHLEPTNICLYNCRFCSFSRKQNESGSWCYSMDEINNILKNLPEDINEIHITAGTHPDASLAGYEEILKMVRKKKADIHIKAFSAAELFYVFHKEGVGYSDGLKRLISAGLNSIPGGGAEIFNETVRRQICPDKVSSQEWLEIHRAAHRQNIFSNATMLYGHIEKYNDRIDHMSRLRNLQDETHGFNAFIPLKYKNRNNAMSAFGETTLLDDLRNYAVARIFLDNIPHIKAYWPMLGKKQAQTALAFGADDIDGTIDNSTDIYVAAGAERNDNSLSIEELSKMISNAGFIPVERYSDYSEVKP